MGNSEDPTYTVDCSSLNRFFWWTLEDGRESSAERRKTISEKIGDSSAQAACDLLTEFMDKGIVISHSEVRDEIKNAGSSVWNRWLISNRSLFKGLSTSPDSVMHELAVKHSDFLAQEKPGRAKHADPWLLAQAKNMGLTIITDDGKLAGIAKEYEIPTISLFGLPEDWKKHRHPSLFD
jgi:predicted nucleic acid-binding protein